MNSWTRFKWGPAGRSKSARLKQSQEMELARSISEIDLVISARVHLALPDKEVFVRQQADTNSVGLFAACAWAQPWPFADRGNSAFGGGIGSKPDQKKMSRLLIKMVICCPVAMAVLKAGYQTISLSIGSG